MGPLDYKTCVTLARNCTTSAFEDESAGPCLVVGAVAETSLGLAYGSLPTCGELTSYRPVAYLLWWKLSVVPITMRVVAG